MKMKKIHEMTDREYLLCLRYSDIVKELFPDSYDFANKRLGKKGQMELYRDVIQVVKTRKTYLKGIEALSKISSPLIVDDLILIQNISKNNMYEQKHKWLIESTTLAFYELQIAKMSDKEVKKQLTLLSI